MMPAEPRASPGGVPPGIAQDRAHYSSALAPGTQDTTPAAGGDYLAGRAVNSPVRSSAAASRPSTESTGLAAEQW
jgi:hypothetical protein